MQVITQLRAQHKNNLDYVLHTLLAHWSHKQRSSAALVLVDWLAAANALSAEERDLLQTLSTLRAAPNANVALRARKLLISLTLPSFNQRRLQMESSLQAAVEHRDAAARLQEIVQSPYTFFDVLTTFFYHRQSALRMAALEIYIRRAYAAHQLSRIRHLSINGTDLLAHACVNTC